MKILGESSEISKISVPFFNILHLIPPEKIEEIIPNIILELNMNIIHSINNFEVFHPSSLSSSSTSSTMSNINQEPTQFLNLSTLIMINSEQSPNLQEQNIFNKYENMKITQENMIDCYENMKICEEMQDKETEPELKEIIPMELEFEPLFDPNPYLKKREKIMEWILSYSSQLSLSKSSTSLAQHFTDIFFHSYPLEQVKLTLTAILILCSKNSDQKVLYTSHTAYIFDEDEKLLGQKELDCLTKMDGNFPDLTFARMVDLAIWENSDVCKFYAEGEEEFLGLNMVHGIAENLYINHYDWEPNMKDIRYALLLAMKKYTPTKISKLQQKTETLQNEMLEKIEKIGKEWIEKNENNFREIYKNRKISEDYINYEEFCIKYIHF